MSESVTEKSVLLWFILPAMLTFFLVNLFQLSPLLSAWTISILGGGTLLWMALIPTYSLLVATVVGICCFRVAPQMSLEQPHKPARDDTQNTR